MSASSDRALLLENIRAAYIAAGADRSVVDRQAFQDIEYGTTHSEPLSLEAYRSFCSSVWLDEGRQEPVLVSRVEDLPRSLQDGEFRDSAAQARWALPFADELGMPRVDELKGTTGPVAYIDTKDEGLCRLFALHELAHLLVDAIDVRRGHGVEWSDTYARLIRKHLGDDLCGLWEAEFQWSNMKAKERIAADPDWLAQMIR